MSGSHRTSTGIRYFVIVLCFSLSNHVRLASGWAHPHSNLAYPYQDGYNYAYDQHQHPEESDVQSWSWVSGFEPRLDLDHDQRQDVHHGQDFNFNDYEGYEYEQPPQYRSDQIIVNEEGIPVRVVWPVGYRPPPPRPTQRPQPTTTVSPFAIQIAELNKQEEEALAAKKRKKKKQKQKRPSDPLLEQEDDYDEYDDHRDQYDEEDEHEYADADTSSEELSDDYGDYDDGDASSEDLDDLGGGGGGGGGAGGAGGWYGGGSGAAAVASGWYGGAGSGWGGGASEGGGGGKKKKKNKNKGKNKKRKCKRKKGQNCNQGPPRPPPWEKWAPLPRPQRLQEVKKWGYQNEYNRGWGKNKHLAEKQKAAWIAARKREAQYKEWFENLPEEQQEAIVRGQMEQRRRVQYHAYGYAQREIGGLPLAPSGPTHDYFPPPGISTAGRGPTGGGGWTTRII